MRPSVQASMLLLFLIAWQKKRMIWQICTRLIIVATVCNSAGLKSELLPNKISTYSGGNVAALLHRSLPLFCMLSVILCGPISIVYYASAAQINMVLNISKGSICIDDFVDYLSVSGLLFEM